MKISHWFLKKAGVDDYEKARKVLSDLDGKIEFRDRKNLYTWMKKSGWKPNWFFVEQSFRKRIVEEEKRFRQAIAEKKATIMIPVDSYRCDNKYLEDLDQDYENGDYDGMVSSLSDLRRAIDAGVLVLIDGNSFDDSSKFYNWVHKRWHLLEECADKWILSDY